jgi:Domain of unknown function (DUF6766)
VVRKFFRDNGLTFCLLGLFASSLIGQVLAGHLQHNAFLEEHGQPAVPLTSYFQTGELLEATFENWESEFLQMALYVWLTSFLFQRGSAESKDPDKPEEKGRQRAHGLRHAIYRNSLSIAFGVLFLISFVLHLMGSTREACREERLHGGTCQGVIYQIANSRFWFESFQNWQSEFLSVAALVVLSIFLRQEGSPESKALDAPNSATGKE